MTNNGIIPILSHILEILQVLSHFQKQHNQVAQSIDLTAAELDI